MHGVWDWYQNEEKKRKERRMTHDTSLINHSLQRILQKIDAQVNREKYQREEQEACRVLSHSGIWNIVYANNFENPKVALEQAIFIRKILAKEEIEDKQFLIEEVDRSMPEPPHG